MKSRNSSKEKKNNGIKDLKKNAQKALEVFNKNKNQLINQIKNLEEKIEKIKHRQQHIKNLSTTMKNKYKNNFTSYNYIVDRISNMNNDFKNIEEKNNQISNDQKKNKQNNQLVFDLIKKIEAEQKALVKIMRINYNMIQNKQMQNKLNKIKKQEKQIKQEFNKEMHDAKVNIAALRAKQDMINNILNISNKQSKNSSNKKIKQSRSSSAEKQEQRSSFASDNSTTSKNKIRSSNISHLSNNSDSISNSNSASKISNNVKQSQNKAEKTKFTFKELFGNLKTKDLLANMQKQDQNQSGDLYKDLLQELLDGKTIKDQMKELFGKKTQFVKPNKYFTEMIERAQQVIMKQKVKTAKQAKADENTVKLLNAVKVKLEDKIRLNEKQNKERENIISENTESVAQKEFFAKKIEADKNPENLERFDEIKKEIEKYLNKKGTTEAEIAAKIMTLNIPTNLAKFVLNYVNARLTEIQQYTGKENKIQEIISELKQEYVKIKGNERKDIFLATSKEDVLVGPEEFSNKFAEGKITIDEYFNLAKKHGREIDKKQFLNKAIQNLQKKRQQEEAKTKEQLGISDNQLMKLNFANAFYEDRIRASDKLRREKQHTERYANNPTAEEIAAKGFSKSWEQQLNVDVSRSMNKLNAIIKDDTKSVADIDYLATDMFQSETGMDCIYLVWRQVNKMVNEINSTIGKVNEKYDNAIANLMKENAKESNKFSINNLYKKEPVSLSNNKTKDNLTSSIKNNLGIK